MKRRGPEMLTFGVLGLSCEAPAAPKPPAFHTTARTPNVHMAFKNTPKFHEKTLKRGKKE